jgi:hypothetical protein
MCHSSCHCSCLSRVLQDVRREAARSLALLDASTDGAFEHVFVNRVDFALRCDALISVPLHALQPSADTVLQIQADAVVPCDAIAAESYALLARAFTDRVESISVLPYTMAEWKFLPRPPAKATASTPKAGKKDKHAAASAATAAPVSAAWSRDLVAQAASADFRPGGWYHVHQLSSYSNAGAPHTRVASNGLSLVLGLTVRFDHVNRPLDTGPAADDKVAAAAFRAFWGTKSELRRFKDGTILEAVIWPTEAETSDTVGSGKEEAVPPPPVLVQIARHIVTRHQLGGQGTVEHVQTVLSAIQWLGADAVASTLTPKPTPSTLPPSARRATPAPVARNIDTFRVSEALRAAFDTLNTRLKSTAGLPLTVVSLTPLHPAFRSCSVWIPAPVSLSDPAWAPLDALTPLGVGVSELDESSDVTEPLRIAQQRLRYGLDVIEVVLQFESSARWPDEVPAIARLKTAFYLRIATVMRTAHGMASVVSEEHLDVFVEGFVFRVRIGYEKELHYLKLDGSPSAHAQEMLLSHKPTHAVAMKGFQFKHPMFGPTVRLAQRWVSSHMFSAHVNEEAVELLVAAIFTSACPTGADVPDPSATTSTSFNSCSAYPTPGTPWVGFLRFLHLMGSYPWAEAPLVVDVDQSFTALQLQAVQAAFSASREGVGMAAASSPAASNPERALWLATPRDPNSLLWTSSRPQTHTVTIMAQYARSALTAATTLLHRSPIPPRTHWLTLFKTPLHTFDVFIVLREDVMCVAHRSLFTRNRIATTAVTSDDENEDDDDAEAVRASKKSKRGFVKPPPAAAASAVTQNPEMAAAVLQHRQQVVCLGLDPIQRLVAALQAHYDGLVEFYYDALAPALITGKFSAAWMQHVSVAGVTRPFSVTHAAVSKPIMTASGVQMVLNEFQLLLDIKRFGSGVVDDVFLGHDRYSAFVKTL